MIPAVFVIVESWKQRKYLSQGNRAIFCDLLIPGRALGTDESSLFVTCSHLLVPFLRGEIIIFKNTNIMLPFDKKMTRLYVFQGTCKNKNPSINVHKNFLYIREYNKYKIVLSQVLKKR